VSEHSTSDYRLAPAFAARIVGAGFVLAAVVVFATTVLGLLAGWSLTVVLAVAGAGLAAMIVVAVRLRSLVVVRFDDSGYRVRLVRGVGVAAARWSEVDDAVTADAAGEPCILLRLASGATSTIPLRVVAADPDAFVTDLRARLQRGHGLRPVGGADQ
jgi:hypothetical protein